MSNGTAATRLITDEELLGVTIPVFLLAELRDIIDDLKKDLQIERRERRRSELLIADLVQLLVDLEDEGRRRTALYKMRRQLERREAEYSLPTFFWRAEKHRDTVQMLRWRAKYLLYRAKAGPENTWALLQEFNQEYSGNPVDDETLKKIILEAKHAPICSPS